MTAAPALAAGPAYRLTDLGPLNFTPNPDDFGTFGINNLGEVAWGYSPSGGAVQPAIWLPEPAYGYDDGPHLMDRPQPWANDHAILRDVNIHGHWVGQVGGLEVFQGRGVIYNLGAQLEDPILLPLLCDSDWSRGIAISDASPPVVIAQSDLEYPCNPCLPETADDRYLAGYTVQIVSPPNWVSAPAVVPALPDPPPPPPQVRCDKTAITNDVSHLDPGGGATLIAGFSTHRNRGLVVCDPAPPTPPRPAAWDAAPHKLPTMLLDGAKARGVNRRGELVGLEEFDQLDLQSFARYWDSPDAATYFNLGSIMPPGQSSDQSRAEAINSMENPQAVGANEDKQYALLWQKTGPNIGDWTVKDLNDEIPEYWSVTVDITLQQAHDVNDEGWIITWGSVDPGTGVERHAYLLTPITSCIADIVVDGTVDALDLLELLSQWDRAHPKLCTADVNYDGVVNVQDLLLLLAHWGPCGRPPQPIPQTIQDCLDRFMDDPIALQACIEAVDG